MKYSISSWGIRAVNTAADYNGQQSIALLSAFEKMGDPEDEFMIKVHDVLTIEEVQDKLATFTASKLQNEEYAHTRENLLYCWEVLLANAVVYAFIGLILLEFIDKDSR